MLEGFVEDGLEQRRVVAGMGEDLWIVDGSEHRGDVEILRSETEFGALGLEQPPAGVGVPTMRTHQTGFSQRLCRHVEIKLTTGSNAASRIVPWSRNSL